MAHGDYTRSIAAELVSSSPNAPVTSAEQILDYSQLNSNNNPKTQEEINAEVVELLQGVDPHAEENQNAFSNIVVGSDTIAAQSKTDTFELSSSGGVSLSTNGLDVITVGLNLSAAISNLAASTDAATRTDYIVAQYAGGNDANPVNNTYYRRSVANLFKALNQSDINTALGYVPYSQTSANALAERISTLESNAILKDSSGNVAITTGNVTLGKAGATIQLAGSSVKWGSSELATQYWVNNQGFAMNSVATTSANGLMSSDDKTKLNGIAAGAEVNQNAFSRISGISHGTFLNDVNAETKTDQFTFIAGDNITLENITGKGIKISASGGGGGGGVTSVAMTVPAGLSISGSPITSTGTLALSTDPGYVIPLAADIEMGITAWGWGNHALAGYLTGNLKSTTKATYDSNTISNTQYRQYAVTPDKSGYLSVNVPWEAYSNATTSAAGLMSASDKTKLNGIATGAEVNQNAFSNVKVGSTTIAADSKTDTLELVAGNNITLTADATNDKVTISATGGGGGGGISSVKSLNTDNSESQSPANETISGTGTINLHKTSKTGKYDDLVMDREAATGSMGRILLKKVSGTADYTAINNQMSGNSNTVFIVRDSFDIGTGTVTVPAGCVLKFEGGSIVSSNSNGGTITGNNTAIDAELVDIFSDNINIEGTWNVEEAYPEWFGAGKGNIIGYNAAGRALTDDTSAIQKATNAFDYVKLTGIYTITGVTVPQFHTVENSTTYVLDSDENTYAGGYKLMMKSTLKGGTIEVCSRFKYYIDSINNRIVRPSNVVKTTITVPKTNSIVIGTVTYYYTEVTVPSGNIIKVTDESDSYGYLLSYEHGGWVVNRNNTVTSTSSSYKVRIARHSSYYGDGKVTYDRVTSYAALQSDFQDYNAFIKNRTSAITIAEESSNNRRVLISGIQIFADSIYDSNNNKIAGGAKDSYIAAAIKTEAENVSTKWNSFLEFTDIDIYGLFYGIVGNLRACRFNITMEQCYDNIDIYGDLNVFNLNGQTGVSLDLNPNDTQDPDRPYDYFMYINGTANVINEGIYDIGSKPRNQQYMIKQASYNVINSRALLDYNNIISNKLNGDFKAGTKYSWVGSTKHDYLLKGLSYTATLENSTFSGNINSTSLFDPSVSVDLTPTGTYDSSTRTYSNTMRLTIVIENILEPCGIVALAQSNSMHFDLMKVYYNLSSESDILVGAISRSNTPYLDWNPDYNIAKNLVPKRLKLIFEGNRQVVWLGLKIYGKTTQGLYAGTVRPTKDLYAGQQFFDTSIQQPVIWNGSSWVNSSESSASLEVMKGMIPASGTSYTSVTLTGKNVVVQCYPDRTFVLSNTATGSGGFATKLSEVFTVPSGTVRLSFTVLEGTLSHLSVFLVNNLTGTSIKSVSESSQSNTFTLGSDTQCFIGMNVTSGTNYSGLKVLVSVQKIDTINNFLTDIYNRLEALS